MSDERVHIIVFCPDMNDIGRLFDFIRENEDNYKFIRRWRRATSHKDWNKSVHRYEGRVIECRDQRAAFVLALMFPTGAHVI